MKLLKQGVEEEAAACPPEYRLENAYVDPVAKVEALSAQLILLVYQAIIGEKIAPTNYFCRLKNWKKR